jgi:MSHA biogenesis protein MshM
MSSLYLAHFGLNRPPFKITPEPEFFFSGERRGDALAGLLHVASNEEGITTVIAEVGSGKTLLSRLMLRKLPSTVSTVYLANPCFTRDEILSAIARDLGLEDLPTATEAKLARIHRELLRRHAAGQRVLLVVDEAHAMPPESLEEIRLLSNLETDAHKLVNVMLFGQPELDTVLADHRLRQVRDRIIHRFEIKPLSTSAVSKYVTHRLHTAGYCKKALFNASALSLLAIQSGGRARRINLLADKALLAAYSENSLVVTKKHILCASHEINISDIKLPTRKSYLQNSYLIKSAAIICITLASLFILMKVININTEYLANSSHPPTSSTTHDDKTIENVPSQLPSPIASTSFRVAEQLANPLDPTVENGLRPYLNRLDKLLLNPVIDGYTVQLAALSPDDGALKYVAIFLNGQELDLDQLYAQYSSYHGQNYVSLFWGRYNTKEEARAAIAKLPTPLLTNRPLVRTWLKIQQDQAS